MERIDLSDSDLDLCTFCYLPTERRVLYRDENVYVMPTLGQFVEGYVLLIHQSHVDCFGEVADDEILAVKRQVREAIEAEYGSCCFFEHGRTGSCFARGSRKICYHAHVHCLPIEEDFADRVSADFDHEILDSWTDLPEYYRANPHYLYLETDDGRKNVYAVEESIERQYLRKLACEALGISRELADWRAHPERETMAATAETLAGRF